MNVFDLMNLESFPYDIRSKNVFYQTDEFKTRVIELEPGMTIPDCQMQSHVIFYVVSGEVIISCNGNENTLKEHQVLITEPAKLSIRSENGALLMGIQINKSEKE